MIAYYLLLLLWIMPGPIVVRRAAVRKSAAAIVILLALNVMAWTACLKTGGDALKVTFLDVGQGDAAFIEFPGGENLLIDAGPGGDEESFDAGRSVVAPFLWNKGVRRIDTIIITHPHEDHLGGAVYLLKNFRVGAVLDSGAAADSRLYDAYLEALRAAGVRRITVGEGDAMRFGAAKLFILSPEKGREYSDENARSVVGKLAYKGRSILFCGDVTSDAMEAAIGRYGAFLRSDVMKVPHHGGAVGNQIVAKNFFEAVSPKTAIISTGRARRYDWRKGNIVTYLRAITYDTINSGAITVAIGPAGYAVTTFVKINRLFYTLS